MGLLIKYEDEKLSQLSMDIASAELEMQNYKNLSNYQVERSKMPENINKQETSLMAIKKKRNSNVTYKIMHNSEWGRWTQTPRKPKSILKKSFHGTKPNPQVNLDSTDVESTDYTTDASESEEMLL